MKYTGEVTVQFQFDGNITIWYPLSIENVAADSEDDFRMIATIVMNTDRILPEPETEGSLIITVGNFTTGETEAKVLEIGAVSDAEDAPVVCKIAYRKSV